MFHLVEQLLIPIGDLSFELFYRPRRASIRPIADLEELLHILINMYEGIIILSDVAESHRV